MATGTMLRFAAALVAGACLPMATAAAQEPTAQGPASAQPTLPRPMPNLTVPVAPTGGAGSGVGDAARHRAEHHAWRHHRDARSIPLERPALANVELLEPLPRPPQPPHVTVPTLAYPFEDVVAAYTTPPPPVVCRPTRRDRFKPDLGLVDERPVLCTADNP